MLSIILLLLFFFTNIDESSSDLTEITEDYDTDYVRYCLRKYGFSPGPLVPSTKQLYIRKLNRIKRNHVDIENETQINILPSMFIILLTLCN